MPSYHDSARILEMFRDYLPARHPVTGVTTADVRDWLKAKRSGLGPGTLNTELTYISSLLYSAGSYFPELEGFKPPRLPYPRKPEERNRPLSLREAKEMVEWLRAPGASERERATRLNAADLFQLALMTGMRQSEWRTRRWSPVDFEAGTVTLTKTKMGKTRVIRMSASVREILGRRNRERRGASEFVFQGRPGPLPHPLTMNPIRRQLVLASTALDIPYGRNVEGGFMFHDTRHTAITEMLAGGNDLATVADISGHSKKSMTIRYGHATRESRERAMRTLEKFGGESEESQ